MKLLTVPEAARQLAIAPRTLRKLIKTGSLRGVKIGRERRVDPDDIAFFVRRWAT